MMRGLWTRAFLQDQFSPGCRRVPREREGRSAGRLLGLKAGRGVEVGWDMRREIMKGKRGAAPLCRFVSRPQERERVSR